MPVFVKEKMREGAWGKGKAIIMNARRLRGSKMSSAPRSTTWLFPGWLIILCGWPHQGCSQEAADNSYIKNMGNSSSFSASVLMWMRSVQRPKRLKGLPDCSTSAGVICDSGVTTGGNADILHMGSFACFYVAWKGSHWCLLHIKGQRHQFFTWNCVYRSCRILLPYVEKGRIKSFVAQEEAACNPMNFLQWCHSVASWWLVG